MFDKIENWIVANPFKTHLIIVTVAGAMGIGGAHLLRYFGI